MTRKIIIAGACTLLILAAMRLCSEIALMERGYRAFGGEICTLPLIAFSLWAAVKTVKDIGKGWKNGTIPASKVGTLWRITKKSLMEYLGVTEREAV